VGQRPDSPAGRPLSVLRILQTQQQLPVLDGYHLL
jgi:hypothetical protein